MSEVVLVVHGGAGRLSRRRIARRRRTEYQNGLACALRTGQDVLLRGGSAVRAVAAAVTVLEDNSRFNAGTGAVLCADGTIELSASIMNGRDLRVGAMVGMTRTKNPVRAAQALMRHQHGLLFGTHADAYAESQGLAAVAAETLVVPFRRRQWQRAKRHGRLSLDHSDGGNAGAMGTVGAVARDRRGNLAAATSTGGLVNQLPGRVGDTPVVGAGTWAANGVCAVSATGQGDTFARVSFARRVADLIELAKMPTDLAAQRALGDVKQIGGVGGCIIIDADGQIAMPFTTAHMLRGWVRGRAAPSVAILPDDACTPN